MKEAESSKDFASFLFKGFTAVDDKNLKIKSFAVVAVKLLGNTCLILYNKRKDYIFTRKIALL